MKTKICFQDPLSLNAGQKYCRKQGEHSAKLSTFIKVPLAIKIYVLSFFKWPFYTGFTVYFQVVISVTTIIIHSKLYALVTLCDIFIQYNYIDFFVLNCFRKISFLLN